MTDAELARLQALADAATPGPWAWEPQEATRGARLAALEGDRWVSVSYADEMEPEDGEFIALARTAVPALCQEVRRLCLEVEGGQANEGQLWERLQYQTLRAERAEAACAALRAALQWVADMDTGEDCPECGASPCPYHAAIEHALCSDAGKGWDSLERAQELRAALEGKP